MIAARPARRLWTWIAVAAVLFASWAPAISQVVQGAGGNAWVEICTAAGAKWVNPDASQAGETSPAAGAAHPLEHCPYCSLNAHGLGTPAADPQRTVLSDLRFERPRLFLLAPRTLYAWTAAQPRGPPLLT